MKLPRCSGCHRIKDVAPPAGAWIETYYDGCEKDPDYWQAQEERYKNHIKQAELFEFAGGVIK